MESQFDRQHVSPGSYIAYHARKQLAFGGFSLLHRCVLDVCILILLVSASVDAWWLLAALFLSERIALTSRLLKTK